MSLLKKILAPTDFSDISAAGVRYACKLAQENDAELIIFHVVALDETNKIDKREMDRHRLRLDQFVADKIADVSPHLGIRKLVDAGDAYGSITRCAENENLDLIVMSSHGRSGLSRMLIGSVTDKVLRGASCPVLVVPVKNER